MALETVDFRRIVNTDAVIVGSLAGLSGKLALTSEAFDPGIIAKVGAGDVPIKFTPDKAWVSSAWQLTDKVFGGVTANTVTTGALVVSGATTLSATSATVLTASTRVTTPEVRAASSAGLTLANSSGTAVALLGAGPGTGVTLYGGLVGTTATFTGAVGTGALSATTGVFTGTATVDNATADGHALNRGTANGLYAKLATGWTAFSGVAAGDNMFYMGRSDGALIQSAIVLNGRFNSGVWTRPSAGIAQRIEMLSGGYNFFRADSGAAGSSITWITTATINADGAATVANATADGHAVNRVTGDARYGRLASANTWTQTNNFQAVTATTVNGTVATFTGTATVANATADGHAVNRVTGDARYLTTAQFSTSVTLVSASEVKNYRIARITVPDTAYRYAVIPLAIKAGFAGQDEAILEIEWFRSGSGNGAILVHGHGPRSLRTSSFVRCEESSPNVIDIYVEAQDAITSGLWLYSWGRASRTNATSIDYTGGSWVDSFAPGSGASNGLFQEGGSISVNDVTCGAITSSGGVVSRGLSISENDYIYLKGNATTDGSIRFYASGDDVFFQRRISGTWTNIFTIEG